MPFRSKQALTDHPAKERILSIRQFRCPRPTPRQYEPSPSPDVLGKLQPQALEPRKLVLGAMMMEQVAVNSVIDVLKPESFYRDAHRRIYAAIVDLFHASEPIDILTVTEALRKLGDLQQVGGAQAVAALTARVASSANIEAQLRIIAQKPSSAS